MISRKEASEKEALLSLGNDDLGSWTLSSKLTVNVRFARMSWSFSVLRQMNYKYFKLCH